jgi:hypothetical protein
MKPEIAHFVAVLLVVVFAVALAAVVQSVCSAAVLRRDWLFRDAR